MPGRYRRGSSGPFYVSLFLTGLVALFAYVTNSQKPVEPQSHQQPKIILPSMYTDGPFNEAGNDVDLVELIKQHMGRIGGGSGFHNCNYVITAGHVTDGKDFTFEGMSTFNVPSSDFLVQSDNIGEDYIDYGIPDINVSKAPNSTFCLPVGQAPEKGDIIQIFGYKGSSPLIDGFLDVTKIFPIYISSTPRNDLIEKVKLYDDNFGGFSGGITVMNNQIIGVHAGANGFENISDFRLDYLLTLSPETYTALNNQVFSYGLATQTPEAKEPSLFSSVSCDSELKDAPCTNLWDNKDWTYWTNNTYQAPFSKVILNLQSSVEVSSLEIIWGESCMNEYYIDIYDISANDYLELYITSQNISRVQTSNNSSKIQIDTIQIENLAGYAATTARIRIRPILPCENSSGYVEKTPTFSIYEVTINP